MKCPKCGSTQIIISEKLEYNQYWTIDGNKLYKTNKDSPSPTGEIWIHCIKCREEDIEFISPEYKCTKEQAKQISRLLLKERTADITEFMEEDFDWRIDDE